MTVGRRDDDTTLWYEAVEPESSYTDTAITSVLILKELSALGCLRCKGLSTPFFIRMH